MFETPMEETQAQEFCILVADVFSGNAGNKLIEEFKEMLMEPRWSPTEEASVGFYREGGNAMLRYIINCYKQGNDLKSGNL
jgi:hypothetical protein